MESIRVTFTIDPASYLRLMRKVAFQKRYPIIGISLAAYFFFMFSRQSEQPDPWYVWILPPVLFVGLIWMLFNLSIKKSFAFSTQLHHPLQYTFGEDLIEVQSEAGTATYQWPEFERVRELPEWLLLYQNQVKFNPIPVSAFSAEQLDAFRNLLVLKGLL
jgi:hypothetical protein